MAVANATALGLPTQHGKGRGEVRLREGLVTRAILHHKDRREESKGITCRAMKSARKAVVSRREQ